MTSGYTDWVDTVEGQWLGVFPSHLQLYEGIQESIRKVETDGHLQPRQKRVETEAQIHLLNFSHLKAFWS